jgi:hypothetical protein
VCRGGRGSSPGDEGHTLSYNPEQDGFRWSAAKDALLRDLRGIGFADVVAAIASGGLVEVRRHPNQTRYAIQRLFLVELRGYVYVVPAVPEPGGYFLKTIIPSRKATREWRREGTNGDEAAENQ